jgi:hypothetical protein
MNRKIQIQYINEPFKMQSKQVTHDVEQSNDFSRPRERDRDSALPVCEEKFVFGFVEIRNTWTEMENNRPFGGTEGRLEKAARLCKSRPKG